MTFNLYLTPFNKEEIHQYEYFYNRNNGKIAVLLTTIIFSIGYWSIYKDIFHT